MKKIIYAALFAMLPIAAIGSTVGMAEEMAEIMVETMKPLIPEAQGFGATITGAEADGHTVRMFVAVDGSAGHDDKTATKLVTIGTSATLCTPGTGLEALELGVVIEMKFYYASGRKPFVFPITPEFCEAS